MQAFPSSTAAAPLARRCRPLWLVLLFALTACGFEPSGEESMSAPTVYREWWAKTEACSGRTGDFDRIRWFEIPGHSFDCPSGRCVGRWQTDGRIFVAGDWLQHEMVVRHEMLHALIGHTGHPDLEFRQECRLTWDTWAGDSAASTAPSAASRVGISALAPQLD
jgi:hypothetical protein